MDPKTKVVRDDGAAEESIDHWARLTLKLE